MLLFGHKVTVDFGYEIYYRPHTSCLYEAALNFKKLIAIVCYL